MFKFCKNTCDLCQNDPNEVIRKRFHDEPNAGIPEWHTANIQTTTKTTEITTSTSSCTDKYNTCEFSKPLCESKYKAIMEKRCPKTCGVC
ncbi:ShKT domain-containing protein [Caenorhabditis elegans]|nr:ShKT domain-containing protein [Caenorhabditis elegans]CAY39359.1 ShKT domain-containing protein [Caenorhabditis elegans]|eukprot:NP_001256442.1 Uncharacterized protein CELE_F56H9.8 [Caenorhabditis elegans]